MRARGHEIGNHTDTHPFFHFKSPQFIYDEMARAQEAIFRATGVAPQWLTLTRVPTAVSPASKYGLIAFSAALSMAIIMTGVKRTAGSVHLKPIGKVLRGQGQRE